MDRIYPSGRLVTVSFYGSVPLNSNKTFVSKLVGVPFVVRRIIQSFPAGLNRTMTTKYFISNDPEASTTEAPNGVNILGQFGQVSYITGDDERKEFEQETEIPSSNGYIKLYCENSDTFDHTLDAQVVLELLPRAQRPAVVDPKPV